MLQAGMAYVMLGRAECLQDVYIDKKDYDVSKIRCCQLAKNESDRLEEKAENRKYHTNFFESGYFYIGFINIQSLKAHWLDFQKDQSFQKCHMIGLCETWLDTDEEVELPNYDSAVVNVGRGQGIATFNNLHAKVVFKQGSRLLSIMALEFQQWLVIFIYASQNASKAEIIAIVATLCKERDNNTIILGDFNWNYLEEDNSLKKFFKETGFHQLVKNPTHELGGLLDHVYVRGEECKISLLQKARYYSDHDAVFLKIN